MTHPARFAAAIVCSLLIVGAWISAQLIAPERIDPPITLSGADIAFRVEARRGNRSRVGCSCAWMESGWRRTSTAACVCVGYRRSGCARTDD